MVWRQGEDSRRTLVKGVGLVLHVTPIVTIRMVVCRGQVDNPQPVSTCRAVVHARLRKSKRKSTLPHSMTDSCCKPPEPTSCTPVSPLLLEFATELLLLSFLHHHINRIAHIGCAFMVLMLGLRERKLAAKNLACEWRCRAW